MYMTTKSFVVLITGNSRVEHVGAQDTFNLNVLSQVHPNVLLSVSLQIYSGGVLRACRHAVLRQTAKKGVARTTYCNFWYAMDICIYI